LTFDPYGEMPSMEDLKKAGAADWLSDALSEQRKKDASLLAGLGGVSETLDAQKKDIQGLLELPPEENPDEETPDLFAAERAAEEKRKASLSGLLGDLQESQKAEKERLKKLF
jgi:hypothetical protein